MPLFRKQSKAHSLDVGPLSAGELFALKAQMLEEGRQMAKDAGEEFTLEHYRFACENNQVPGGPKVWSDMKGLPITGMLFSDPTHPRSPIRSTEEFYNLQSTGAISEFYTNLNFNEAHLKDCIVDPATSFNEQLAKAKELENITFRNMESGEKFTFGAGAYKNISVENIKGGTIAFADNSNVDGVTFSGSAAEMIVGKNAVISHADVSDQFRIVSLHMEPGATIQNSDFKDATLSMTSEIAGSRWQNVTFGNISHADLSGGEFSNVIIRGDAKSINAEGATFKNTTFGGDLSKSNFEGATLANVTLNGKTDGLNLTSAALSGVTINGPTEGLNLEGAQIENLVINGKLITDAAQLQEEFGISANVTTHITFSAEAVEQDNARRALEQAAEVGAEAGATWNQSTAPLPLQRTTNENLGEGQNVRMRDLEQEQQASGQSSPQPHQTPSINTATEINGAQYSRQQERSYGREQEEKETAKEEPQTAQDQTKAPYIGIAQDAQVQHAPTALAATNDNQRNDPQILPQERGEERAKARVDNEVVPTFAAAIWKKDGEKIAAAQEASQQEIALQGGLQHQKSDTPGVGIG